MNGYPINDDSLPMNSIDPARVDSSSLQSASTLSTQTNGPTASEQKSMMLNNNMFHNSGVHPSFFCSPQLLYSSPSSETVLQSVPASAPQYVGISSLAPTLSGPIPPNVLNCSLSHGVQPTAANAQSGYGIYSSGSFGRPQFPVKLQPANMVYQSSPCITPQEIGCEAISIQRDEAQTCPSFPFLPSEEAAYPSTSQPQNTQFLQHPPSSLPYTQQHRDPFFGSESPSSSLMSLPERNIVNGSSAHTGNALHFRISSGLPSQHVPFRTSEYLGSNNLTSLPSQDTKGSHTNLLFSSDSSGLSHPPSSFPPHPSPIPGVVGNGTYSHETLSAALSAGAYQSSQELARTKQEEDDRIQLEKIIRLRRELELEEEHDREKEREKETWECVTCTFRNPLSSMECEMCQSPDPRRASSDKSSPSTISGSASSFPTYESSAPWDCYKCHVRNNGRANRCVMCGAQRNIATETQVGINAQKNRASATSTTMPTSAPPSNSYWRCSVCSEVNSPRQINCKICNGFQRNGIPVDKPPNAPPSASLSKGSITTNATPSNESNPTSWNCSVCTLVNSVHNPVCSLCASGQRPRHLAPQGIKKEKELASKNMQGDSRTSWNTPSATSSSSSAFPRALFAGSAPSEWCCPVCTFLNKASRSRCDMCGTNCPSETVEQKKKKGEEDSDDDEEGIMWQEDHIAKACNYCGNEFGLLRRRHHCRACGYVFCATCTPFSMSLKKEKGPVRVCIECFSKNGKKQP